MKDKKLLFDRSCHVLYSKPCKKELRTKIALHYPEAEREMAYALLRFRRIHGRRARASPGGGVSLRPR